MKKFINIKNEYTVSDNQYPEKSAEFIGSSLKEIAIPDKVTKIGRYAFNKTSLKNVSIGKGVTEIRDSGRYCMHPWRLWKSRK